jgi:hypothetical protein
MSGHVSFGLQPFSRRSMNVKACFWCLSAMLTRTDLNVRSLASYLCSGVRINSDGLASARSSWPLMISRRSGLSTSSWKWIAVEACATTWDTYGLESRSCDDNLCGLQYRTSKWQTRGSWRYMSYSWNHSPISSKSSYGPYTVILKVHGIREYVEIFDRLLDTDSCVQAE